MRRLFGDRSSFAVEVGEALAPSLREVDLWAAGTLLTSDDNVTYVPAFCHYMRSAAARVRQREVRPHPYPGLSPHACFRRLEADKTAFREQYWFLRWSETVDHLSCYAYLDSELIIACAFSRAGHRSPGERGDVVIAGIAPDEFVATLLAAADVLDDLAAGEQAAGGLSDTLCGRRRP